MGWFDGGFLSGLGSLFGGGGDAGFSVPTSVEPDVLGSAAQTAQDTGSSLDAFGGIAPAAPAAADTGAGIAGANDAFTGGGLGQMPVPSGTPAGMPPNLPSAASAASAPPPAPATLGSAAPNQGGSVAGNNFGPDQSTSDAVRSAGSPYYSTTPGTVGTANPAASVASAPPQPPPTAWESIQNAPGKWWQTAATGAGNEVNTALANPIKTGLQVASIGAPLLAAAMAPSAKQPGKYTLNPPQTAQQPVAPLPGTTSNQDLPAASPMSPLLTGQGGFRVQGGRGLRYGGRI